MANTLAWTASIRHDRVATAPFGTAKIAVIDERDVAAVATTALMASGTSCLRYATPLLSGPAELTARDQLRILGEVIGVPLRFEEISADHFITAMVSAGEPAGPLRDCCGTSNKPAASR